MSLRSIPAVYMRGGTSRALIFRRDHLPEDSKLWDEIFLAALGSPDPYGRQLNGMGGGTSSLSKVAIVGPSERSEADVDYTFAQVSVTESKVDYKGNCGNISSAIGPYAIEQGWVQGVGSQTTVRVYNTNTQKIIHSHFPASKDKPEYHGNLSIPGVAGTGAPIRLEFIAPGGATTGQLLPTGRVRDVLTIPEIGDVEVSLVDAANACVFVDAKTVGLQGTELPTDFEAHPKWLQKLDLIRRHASVKMGIARDIEHAKSFIAIPYIGIVSDPQSFQPLGENYTEASSMDFSMRVIASGQPHKALPLTVSLCAAVASQLTGSVVAKVSAGATGEVRIGMPSGVLTLAAQVENKNGHWTVHSGSFYRTARLLFEGRVFY
ncbi:MAG: 2-methylaconitate cis-trans isomerase PrpF family protein [Bacillota bacterium]